MRGLALLLMFALVGCADSRTDLPPAIPPGVIDEEAELQAAIDSLSAEVDETRGAIEEGFEDVEAMRNRLDRDQQQGDSLRQRIEANQREIDALVGQ